MNYETTPQDTAAQHVPDDDAKERVVSPGGEIVIEAAETYESRLESYPPEEMRELKAIGRVVLEYETPEETARRDAFAKDLAAAASRNGGSREALLELAQRTIDMHIERRSMSQADDAPR